MNVFAKLNPILLGNYYAVEGGLLDSASLADAGMPCHALGGMAGSDAMGGYSLEDYIYSLEARGGGANNTANIHSGPKHSEFGLVN